MSNLCNTKKLGRPVKNLEDKKTELFQCRLTKAQKEKLTDMGGVSLIEYALDQFERVGWACGEPLYCHTKKR